MSLREQDIYIQGLEDMYNIIKAIFELTIDRRMQIFGEDTVPAILDKFDFQQIREKMVERIVVRYVIRGIKVNDQHEKRVIAESGHLKFRPDEDMVKAFLDVHPHVTFACVEEIYVKE